MKYDWSSRNAASLALASLACYFAWRGFPGRWFVMIFVADILAIGVVSVVSRRSLRGRLALLVSISCVEAAILFWGEWKCSPVSVCTAASGLVFALNTGAICFLLWPTPLARIEV